MSGDIEAIKERLKKDENMWLKIQMQANQQHSINLNQLADLFALVNRLITRIDKNEERLKMLEEKIKGE